MKLFLRKNTQYSDHELIEHYQSSGDSWYVGELFQKYAHLISALAFKYLKNELETEDAVMDVFEIMTKDLKTHEVKNFNAWIYSVTKNHCLKVKRRKNKEREQEGSLQYTGTELFGTTSDEELERLQLKEEQLDLLEEALEALNPEQKLCVEMFFLNKKSYQEISDETGYTLKQVKSYLQNGKRNLKGHLTKSNEYRKQHP